MATVVSAPGEGDDGEPLPGDGRTAAQPPTPPGDVPGMGVPVTPHATNSGNDDGHQEVRLVAAGIDTLDLGFYVRWPTERTHHKLDELRAKARGTNGIQEPGGAYLVLPSGKQPMYRYHLQYPQGHLYVAPSLEPTNFPNVYVSISARSLWLDGAANAVSQFRSYIEALGGVIEKVVPSRVDLAADFYIPGGLTLDFLQRHVVSKSRSFRHYVEDDKLQTFYIAKGSSAIQMRIYDKWAEILKSDKVFFIDVWASKLTRPGIASVWRIEGQFRREILKEFGVDSVEWLFAKLAGLWNYLTDWASLRIPDDANASRRTLHPIWEAVRAASAEFGDPCLISRRYTSESCVPVDWYVQHIAGCLIALAARERVTDFSKAIASFFDHAVVKMPPEVFRRRVEAELIRLGFSPNGGAQ